MTDERLKELENIGFLKPKASWEVRKQQIHENLEKIIEIFEKNTDDKAYIASLRKMEAKFK